MTGRAFWAPLAARLRAVLADEQKRVKLLVLMGLAGLALLAVSAWLPAESTAPPAVQGESTADYAAQLEQRLTALISRVEGAGKAVVMVTLESSEEKIVEKDMTAERSNTEEQDAAGGARTVNTSNTEYRTIYREDTGGDPFVVKTITPKVEGVLVVAEGAGKGNMAGEITQIIQALFGVEAHRIKVLEK